MKKDNQSHFSCLLTSKKIVTIDNSISFSVENTYTCTFLVQLKTRKVLNGFQLPEFSIAQVVPSVIAPEMVRTENKALQTVENNKLV